MNATRNLPKVAALLLAGLLLAATAPLRAQTPPAAPAGHAPADLLEKNWGFVEKYCGNCHNSTDWAGGLAFDTLEKSDVAPDAKVWEEAVRRLRGSLMPPPGEPQPDMAARKSFINTLETTLEAAAVANPNPGSVVLHRLNRPEYANSVRELLHLEIDAEQLLPRDDQSAGFNNIADVLKISPSFLEQYLGAARQVSIEALGNAKARTQSTVYAGSAAALQYMHQEGLPLGTRGGVSIEHWFPADGDYEVTVSGLVGGGYVWGVMDPFQLIVTLDGNRVFQAQVGGEDDLRAIDVEQAIGMGKIDDRFRNIKIKVPAGRHRIGVTYQPKSAAEETPCAKQILGTLARRAFRRPVTEADLSGAMAFYDGGRKNGSFEDGIQKGVLAILASPKFLYRSHTPPADAKPGQTFRLNDLDLASRLSFFLWSGPPDDALIDLAAAGKLQDPAVYAAQVRRMLADPRARSLATNFAAQWLNVGGLDLVNPDTNLFPDYTEDLVPAFKEELYEFVWSIFGEDRSVVDLLTADWTFLNERLAMHYGIRGVRGGEFRKVAVADSTRRGLLGKGAVLMATSYANRTSPVVRGAYILEHLMGTPPTAPPPGVEQFPESQEGAEQLTVRHRLEQHRNTKSCNACHGVIDPVGLAMENFNALGQWRVKDIDAGAGIDAKGKLADGTPVDGVDALRDYLVSRPDLFVQTFTENLLTYALGRPATYYDMPLVRRLVRDAAADNYRFSTLVMGIVTSPAFLTDRAPPGKDGALVTDARTA